MFVSDVLWLSFIEVFIFGILKFCNDLGIRIFFLLVWVYVLEIVVLYVYSDLRKWLS